MPRPFYVLNGPNLNLLGVRQPDVYGTATLSDIEASVQRLADERATGLVFRQSNSEGELVTWIQEAREAASAIVINPGAYSHTSIAILDALTACDVPVVEVHISNIHRREEFRRHSYVSLRADAVIAGFGVEGYAIAARYVLDLVVADGAPSSGSDT